MSNQSPTAPPAAPSAASTRITEIRIGTPEEYDGKAETAQAWLDTVRLYLSINHALYYDDDWKIAFALSYMKKGSAATWAEVHHQQGLATFVFGTFTQFQTDFKTTFVNTNAAQEAMTWLSTTHINSGEQLQEYINTFKLNVVCTKYDEVKDTAMLISYFSAGVPTWIMHCIQAIDTVPTTLALWYEKAAHFCLQKEIAWKIALMHWGNAPQPPRTTFAHPTLVPLMIQMPWTLTCWTYPQLSKAIAFVTIFVLSANSQTAPLETIPAIGRPPAKKPLLLTLLGTRNKFEPPRQWRRKETCWHM